MVSQFKSKSSSAVVWITLLCLFVHLPFIFEGPQVILLPNSPVSQKILAPFQSGSGLVLFFFYMLLVTLQANRLNVAANNLMLFPKENALPGMTYVLFTALLPEWNNISGSLIINTILIETLATFRTLHTTEKPEKLIFNLSLCMGIAVLFYPPAIVLAFLLFLTLTSLSHFKFRLIMVWLIGLILPFYFLAAYLFMNDGLATFPHYLLPFDLHPFIMHEKAIIYIVSFSLILITVMVGMLLGQQNSGKLIISARKVWGVTSFAFFATIGTYFLFQDQMKSILFLVTVPAALIGSNTFLYSGKKWMAAGWFWCIIAGIYFVNLVSLGIIRLKF